MSPPQDGPAAHLVGGPPPPQAGRMSRAEGSQRSGGVQGPARAGGGPERSEGQQGSHRYVLKFGVFFPTLRLDISVAVSSLSPGTVIAPHPHPDGAGPRVSLGCVAEVLSHTGLASVHPRDSWDVFPLVMPPLHAPTPACPSLCVTITSLEPPQARGEGSSGPNRAQDPEREKNKCLVAHVGQAGRARTSESVALSAR